MTLCPDLVARDFRSCLTIPAPTGGRSPRDETARRARRSRRRSESVTPAASPPAEDHRTAPALRANPRTLDREHPELGPDAPIRRKAGESVVRADDTVTRDDHREGVAAESRSDIAGKLLVAEPRSDGPIGQRLAGRDGARDGVDLCFERIDPAEVAGDEREIRFRSFKQRSDRSDGAADGRRRLAPCRARPRGQTGSCRGGRRFRQMRRGDRVTASGNAAVAERGREEREAHHGLDVTDARSRSSSRFGSLTMRDGRRPQPLRKAFRSAVATERSMYPNVPLSFISRAASSVAVRAKL